MDEYCWCDFDPPQFYHAERRRARTPKQCFECSGRIAPGERYEHVHGKWDGRPDVFRTCDRCLELRDFVQGNVPCFCWCHGNMLDDAQQAIEAAQSRALDETGGLMFGFLRRRVKLRRHNKQVKGEYHDQKTSTTP